MSLNSSHVALAVAIVALVLSFMRPPAPSDTGKSTAHETALERVQKTRTLRCAYSTWAPYLMIDPANGNKSGIDYDIMEAVGKRVGLKIDWQAEVGYGSFPEQLHSGKSDAFCVTVWTSSARAGRVILTRPVHYTPVYAFTRDRDTRFDNNIAAINDPSITIAVLDGSTHKTIADNSFPKAKQFSLPEISDGVQPLMALATGKADVVFNDQFLMDDYNKHNPDKPFRRVVSDKPVRSYGEAFAVAPDEWELREYLNSILDELQADGTIDGIISKYETSPGAISRMAKPYL